jgi:hypothetical protein
VSFEQAQHRCVALINGGFCLCNSSIVLSTESLCKKSHSHATATGSVAQSYEEVGITVVVSLGAVRQQSAFHQEQDNACVAGHGSDVTALSVPRCAQARKTPSCDRVI